MTAADYISLSTLTVATVLIALNLRAWWKGGKSFKILLQGICGVILGVTIAICAGGILGDIATWVAGGSNSVIGTIIPWATGAGDRNVAAGSASGLGMEGGLVAVVLIVLGAVAIKAASGRARWRLVGGTFVGICLSFTAGLASIVASHLIPAYNGAGGSVVAFFEGAV